MMSSRKFLFVVVAPLALTECANFEGYQKKEANAHYQRVYVEPTPSFAETTPHVVSVNQSQLMHAKNTGKTITGEAAVERANKKALVEPNSAGTLNAIIVYPYQEGNLYQIYTTPLNVTDVEFQSGEQIISVAAGDTMRWEISKTASGAGGDRIEHLLVKPQSEDLMTTMVVTTNMRTYHIILKSTKNTFMATVQWKYASQNGGINDLTGNSTLNTTDGSPSINAAQLDFSYEMKTFRGRKPDWYPKAVFNDGSKTYIEFPSTIQSAPALFIKDSGSGDAAVNYRVVGAYYVIDQVITSAELMAGNGNTIVQINSTK